ncbi:MAG: alpha-amylase family glycosyl hydrolase [Limisphaerales bacterium]
MSNLKTVVVFVCAALCMATTAPAQSSQPGWGATPYSNSYGVGVTFRVWAPNALSVHVPGTFNSWSTNANPLGKEMSNGVWTGVWSADVAMSNITTNQQYKYYISSTNMAEPWKHDPRSRYVTVDGAGGNDIVYNPTAYNWTGDAAVRPPLEDLAVYELHIGDFYDPRSPNYPSSLPGRFLDATNKLAYVQSLGFNAVEVMPIMDFPGYNSWGYDPAQPFAADNYAYGGPDGFKTFVLACHERGLAVFLDVVHNHYGPTDNDLWNFDGWYLAPNEGGIYFYQSDDLCCTVYGSRPDYSTQQVRNYIQDNFTMWLNECHVDGFRWDTPGLMMNATGYCCNPIADAVSLITNINGMIHTNTGAISIAEDVQGDGFDSTWDTSYYQELTPQLADTLDSERDLTYIVQAMTTDVTFGGSAGFNRVAFLESHDVVGDLNGTNNVRLVTAIDASAPSSWRARKLSTLGAIFTFTGLGVPMIFEGQEMLENQQFDSQRPVDWTKTNTYSYIVRLYHDLINVRRDAQGYTPGLEGSECRMYEEDNVNKLLAYRRWSSVNTSQDVFVIANCSSNIQSNYSLSFPEAGVWYVQFNSDSTNYGSDYGNVGPATVTAQGSPVTASITIGPYSALILSQTPPAPPQLTSGQSNGVVTVSWPNTYGWWVLDSTTALMGSSTSWSQVPSTQYQTNATAVFINPVASAGSIFYRLRNTKP